MSLLNPLTNGTLNDTIADVISTYDFATLLKSAFFPKANADAFWLLMCAFLVFFMQCGFALLEAGTVRAKNTKNILLKNLMDACVGAFLWYMLGHSFAYDAGSGFIGASGIEGKTAPSFFLWDVVGENEDPTGYAMAGWFFQYVFAAAAATIVSGAMAERTALTGYIIYTTIITGFIYPVVVHWCWSGDGFLSAFSGDYYTPTVEGSSGFPVRGGVIDFAGSGIVHMTGGIAALVGAAVVGPRTGKFDEKKKPLPMPGHSTTLQVMGTFILWLGWYGFNPGSTLGIAGPGYSQQAARCVITTTISAAVGGMTVVMIDRVVAKMWSVSAACNGILAGLVSITAGCDTLMPYTALVSGFLGGFVYYGSSKLVVYVCKVDDPLDAFAVHGACGFWGVIAAGLFTVPDLDYRVMMKTDSCKGGAFYGCGDALAAALAQLFCIIAWVGIMSAIMFLALKFAGLLRVSAEVEAAGMDVSKHGGAAYES